MCDGPDRRSHMKRSSVGSAGYQRIVRDLVSADHVRFTVDPLSYHEVWSWPTKDTDPRSNASLRADDRSVSLLKRADCTGDAVREFSSGWALV